MYSCSLRWTKSIRPPSLLSRLGRVVAAVHPRRRARQRPPQRGRADAIRPTASALAAGVDALVLQTRPGSPRRVVGLRSDLHESTPPDTPPGSGPLRIRGLGLRHGGVASRRSMNPQMRNGSWWMMSKHRTRALRWSACAVFWRRRSCGRPHHGPTKQASLRRTPGSYLCVGQPTFSCSWQCSP